MTSSSAQPPKSRSNSSALEITIGIVGNAHVGKNSVLNALLRKNYSHAAMSKRQAAIQEGGGGGCVMKYNVHVVPTSGGASSSIADLKVATEDTVTVLVPTSSSDATTKETVHVKTYDIDIQKEVLPMRNSTSLTCMVLPGVSGNSTDTKYLSYLTDQWEDVLDALIVVLDGRMGYTPQDNTLLDCIRNNLIHKRKIPVIVVCNKMDPTPNPDPILQQNMETIQTQIAQLFASPPTSSSPPKIIAGSATYGYIYRVGSNMTVYQFGEEFDVDLLDLIGTELFGTIPWKQDMIDQEERYRKVHAILCEPKHLHTGLQQCGFGPLVSFLEEHIGGSDRQEQILQDQINLSLQKVQPFQADWIAYSIFSIYHKQKKLISTSTSLSTDMTHELEAKIRHTFWKNYYLYQTGTFTKFTKQFERVPTTARLPIDPIQELLYYHKLVVLAQWNTIEEPVIIAAMQYYIQRYLHYLIRTYHTTNNNNSNDWTPKAPLSPMDWSNIWSSIHVLASYHPMMVESLSQEMITVGQLASETQNWNVTKDVIDKFCTHCTRVMDETKRKPNTYPRCKKCMIVFMPRDTLLGTDAFDCAYCGSCPLGGGESVENGTTPEGTTTTPSYQCTNCQYKHEIYVTLEESLQFTYQEQEQEEKGNDKEIADNDNNTATPAPPQQPPLQLIRVPKYPDKYRQIVHFDIPSSLDDTQHFGHVIYKVCTFVTSITEAAAAAASQKTTTESTVSAAAAEPTATTSTVPTPPTPAAVAASSSSKTKAASSTTKSTSSSSSKKTTKKKVTDSV